jgi:hypothetical protein
MTHSLRVAALLLGMLTCGASHGALYTGEYLGVFPGNDDASAVETILEGLYGGDFSVDQAGKVNSPDVATGDLTLTYDSGPPGTSGTWSYSGPELIGVIAVKAGSNFELYQYFGIGTDPAEPLNYLQPTGSYDPGMINQGLWQNTNMSNPSGTALLDMSHVSAYSLGPAPPAISAIPEPAAIAVWGLMVSLFGTAFLWRRRRGR